MKQSMTPKLLAISMTLGLATPLNLLAQRKPLSVGPLTHLAHEPTSVRQRFDPVRETHLEYQVEGTIEFLPSSGNFLLSWNGHDGTRQREIWEPRDKVAAVVAADVTFDQASCLYTYSYTVSNLPTAIQLLQTLYIEAGTLERAEKPDDGWYSRALTEYLNKELGVAGGWSWSQTRGTLGIPPALGIPPGQTVSGFQLVSRSPPAVVRCFAAGRVPPLRTTEDLPEELHKAIDEVAFRLPVGFTIGPAPEGPALSTAAELSQLQAFLAEAERQGWLGPAASASRVRTALAPLRSSVTAGRTLEAETQVATLLQEMGGAEYEGLLSEGRALLEYRLPLLRTKLRVQR